MLNRLHHELKLPIYCLLDNDPWGYYIYSVIKQGSINLAFESQGYGRFPTPVFLGCDRSITNAARFPDSVQIALNDTDRKAGQTDCWLPLVCQQEAVAEGNREDAEQRLQTGSRSVD